MVLYQIIQGYLKHANHVGSCKRKLSIENVMFPKGFNLHKVKRDTKLRFLSKVIRTITYFPKKEKKMVCNILHGIYDDLLWNGTAVIVWRLGYTWQIYYFKEGHHDVLLMTFSWTLVKQGSNECLLCHFGVRVKKKKRQKKNDLVHRGPGARTLSEVVWP